MKKVKKRAQNIFSFIIILVYVFMTFGLTSSADKCDSEEIISVKTETNAVCTESLNENIDEEASALHDINEYSQNDLTELINPNSYCVSLLYNTNAEKSVNRNLYIYGTIPLRNDAQVVNDAFSALYENIKLYSDEECVFQSNSYTVSSSESDDEGILILFQLTIDEITVDEGIYQIDKIIFETRTGSVTALESNSFWITVYHEENNGVAIMESPSANALSLNLYQFIILDYTFYTVNPESANEFDVSIYMPEKLSDYLDVSISAIATNEDMAELVYNELRYSLSLQQISVLSAYDITVSMTRNTNKHFAVQLLFDVNITGENQLMGAFCPFVVI
ncbi:MAG: hypothetical protein LUF30_03470 [Lachnospiraceae bacterium]|nr:hypothetical protein [Lachnospiraceae bacterium]